MKHTCFNDDGKLRMYIGIRKFCRNDAVDISRCLGLIVLMQDQKNVSVGQTTLLKLDDPDSTDDLQDFVRIPNLVQITAYHTFPSTPTFMISSSMAESLSLKTRATKSGRS